MFAISLVFAALSAVWRILLVICSIVALISSVEAACSLAPDETAWLEEESCSPPERTCIAVSRTFSMVLVSEETMSKSAWLIFPSSSFRLINVSSFSTVKSPSATERKIAKMLLMGRAIEDAYMNATMIAAMMMTIVKIVRSVFIMSIASSKSADGALIAIAQFEEASDV